jgi:lipid-A-disaccharide synthase
MKGSQRVPFVAMPNIILERMAVPELLGDDCRPPLIAEALCNLLMNQDAAQQMRESYSHVRRALGSELPQGATQRTAQILEEMMHGRSAQNASRA